MASMIFNDGCSLWFNGFLLSGWISHTIHHRAVRCGESSKQMMNTQLYPLIRYYLHDQRMPQRGAQANGCSHLFTQSSHLARHVHDGFHVLVNTGDLCYGDVLNSVELLPNSQISKKLSLQFLQEFCGHT